MEAILFGIYAAMVWLIFIRLKLLPWTTPWKVGVAMLPIVALVVTMLLLNVFAPTSTEVKVVKEVAGSEYEIFARFDQNELHQISPGNEAEIVLATHPGRVIKARVDSIIWAEEQGEASGDHPLPGKFPVKLIVEEREQPLFLAAGARGAAAIYTEHLSSIHLIRKVLIRTSSYLNFLIIKHHINLH